MKKLLSIAVLCTSLHVAGQVKVTDIHYQGAEKTKPEYLANFIKTQVGNVFDSLQLKTDRQQLVNLEMFANVTLQVKLSDSTASITFQCEEIATLVPFMSFGRIDVNFWLKSGVSEVNFLGRGQKLTVYHQWYERHSFAAHAQFERIRNSNFGFNLNLIRWATIEPLFFSENVVDYDYTNYNLGAEAVYHLNLTDKLLVGGSVFQETYQSTDLEQTDGPNFARTQKLLYKALWISNRVNSFYYLRQGFEKMFAIQGVSSFGYEPFFLIAFTEWKYFHRYRNGGNLAIRGKVGLSSNEPNPFAPFVLDSYLNIRGVGDRVDRGTGMVVLNAEFRQQIWDRGKYAVQTVGFVDTGGWRQPGGNLEDFTVSDNQVVFGGIGLRMIHKEIYNAILRIDYGWDLLHQNGGGLVIGIGQYF